jgi:Ca2+-binding EF-hand superfamily protein
MRTKTSAAALAVLTLSVSATLLGGPAFATEPYFPMAEKRFARLDANKDGKLVPEELAPVVKKRVAAMDGDGDKALTVSEIDAALQRRIERRRDRIMSLLDANKDGKITEAEMDAVLNDMFDKADTDDDGAVNLAEIRAFKRAKWRKEFLERRSN